MPGLVTQLGLEDMQQSEAYPTGSRGQDETELMTTQQGSRTCTQAQQEQGTE